MNTTLGELLADQRTAGYAEDFKNKLSTIFAAPSSDGHRDEDIAISDEMNTAMVACMPLRNVVSYGFCSKEELLEMIDKMNGR